MNTESRRAVVLGGGAIVAAVLVVLLVPAEVRSLWAFLLYLVPFVLAAEAVAVLPAGWFRRGRLTEVAGVILFVVVFCVFVPKLFARVLADDFAGYYQLMRVLVPLLILGFTLMYRLGGGGSGGVRRIAYASLLVMLSGVEDLLFWAWQGKPLPDRLDWADHITVRLGHVATPSEAYVFIGVHLVAAVLVLWSPRWLAVRLRAVFRAPGNSASDS